MKKIEEFIFIGIDQTGSVDQKGRPRPLPIATLYFDEVWKLAMARLSTLTLNSLISQHKQLGIRLKEKSSLIIVDCVLGLPKSYQKGQAKKNLVEWMLKAKSHSGFGLKAGQLFFDNLKIPGSEKLRVSEKVLNANSVFSPYPSQKNIQTGTFRIWKDIADDVKSERIHIWPYDALANSKGEASLIEGYPSLAYQELIGKNSNQRVKANSKEVKALLTKKNIRTTDQGLQISNEDERDAILLAVYAFHLFKNQPHRLKFDSTPVEGAILGFRGETSKC